MTPLEIVFVARSLVEDESRWCRGAFALDKAGRSVPVDSPAACRFSLTGAFLRVQHITHARTTAAFLAVRARVPQLGSIPLDDWQDAASHWMVLEVLDRAIRALGGTPPAQNNDQRMDNDKDRGDSLPSALPASPPNPTA